MSYIIWNNKDSRSVNGLIICELPPISKPKMRVKETVIDGVDGSIIEELGYESYNKTIAIGLGIGADIDKVTEYFTGNGDVIFSNEPDKLYRARIINGIDYSRLLRFKVAKVTFRVEPFKYDADELEVYNVSGNSMTVSNIGNYTAKPLITIKGTGTVKLSINGIWVCDYTFPDSDDTVILDSEKQDAYAGDALKNRNMVGDFPILAKGTNVVTWVGTVNRISIARYSRWL